MNSAVGNLRLRAARISHFFGPIFGKEATPTKASHFWYVLTVDFGHITMTLGMISSWSDAKARRVRNGTAQVGTNVLTSGINAVHSS